MTISLLSPPSSHSHSHITLIYSSLSSQISPTPPSLQKRRGINIYKKGERVPSPSSGMSLLPTPPLLLSFPLNSLSIPSQSPSQSPLNLPLNPLSSPSQSPLDPLVFVALGCPLVSQGPTPCPFEWPRTAVLTIAR
jgi:hypothetical protein